MTITRLIAKLQEEQRKYGDIEVILHTGFKKAMGEILDVATFSLAQGQGRQVWLSTEEADYE